MTVDLRPLGAPDLGMTRAEMLVQADAKFQIFTGATEMFFAIVFAYVVAMFIAGNQLTRVQYTIANAMYLIVMVNILLSSFITVSDANDWLSRAGMDSAVEWLPVSSTVARATLVSLSIWFGLKVRHPSAE